MVFSKGSMQIIIEAVLALTRNVLSDIVPAIEPSISHKRGLLFVTFPKLKKLKSIHSQCILDSFSMHKITGRLLNTRTIRVRTNLYFLLFTVTK